MSSKLLANSPPPIILIWMSPHNYISGSSHSGFLFRYMIYRTFSLPRCNSSGDRLSVTPDNLSPSPSPGSLLATRNSPYSLSSLEVRMSTTTGGGGGGSVRSGGGTSYASSTLPLRKHRGKGSAEEKNKKVMIIIYIGSCLIMPRC